MSDPNEICRICGKPRHAHLPPGETQPEGGAWGRPKGEKDGAETQERTKLTHVAIRFRGVVYSLPAPSRHHHVIREILKANPDVTTVDVRGDDQGFLDESGRYLTRHQALVSAQLFGQLKQEPRGVLTSEDLW
ncbi:MAG TPA: hypothetical protein VMI75_32160 [Polyangiaceae bacterium]|nr:hypothetical protein [Polyangiaceae bacterium]